MIVGDATSRPFPVPASAVFGAAAGVVAYFIVLDPKLLDPSGTGLLLTGSFKTLAGANWASIAYITFTAAVGIMSLAGAFQGWLFRKTPGYERLMLLVAGVALVYPGNVSNGIGFALVVLVLVSQWLRAKARH